MSRHIISDPVVSMVLMGLQLWNLIRIARYIVTPATNETLDQARKDARSVCLFGAAIALVGGLINFADRDWPPMAFWAAIAAAYIAMWWHLGGGNGTKRRLKKLKEKFVGRRRTAPVTA